MQLRPLLPILVGILNHFDQVLYLLLNLIDSLDIIKPLGAIFGLFNLEFIPSVHFVNHLVGINQQVSDHEQSEGPFQHTHQHKIVLCRDPIFAVFKLQFFNNFGYLVQFILGVLVLSPDFVDVFLLSLADALDIVQFILVEKSLNRMKFLVTVQLLKVAIREMGVCGILVEVFLFFHQRSFHFCVVDFDKIVVKY